MLRHKIYKTFFLREGQTIIEAIVALSLVVVVLTAISVAITSSVNNSQFLKDQSLAAKYSQQSMESMRYLHNNPPPFPTPGFYDYARQSSAFCIDPDGNLTPAGAKCTQVSNFSGVQLVREALFQGSSADCSGGTRVTVNTYWSSGKCGSSDRYCHKSQLISCFSDPSISGNSL